MLPRAIRHAFPHDAQAVGSLHDKRTQQAIALPTDFALSLMLPARGKDMNGSAWGLSCQPLQISIELSRGSFYLLDTL